MNAAEAEWMVEITLARAQEMRAENKRLRAENERLRELLFQALTEGGIPPADYGVALNHDTGQAFLLFGSPEGDDR